MWTINEVPVYYRDDFTFLVERSAFDSWKKLNEDHSIPSGIHSVSPGSLPLGREVLLIGRAVGGEMPHLHGRAQFASCFAGRIVSVTVRTSEQPSSATEDYRTGTIENDAFGWKPKDTHSKGLVSIAELVNSISQLIFQGKPQGLIVIAGSTNSGKSLVAQGLIHEYLLNSDLPGKPAKRRPHLVTFEDPIETYFYSIKGHDTAKILKASQDWPVDYTPQDAHEDVITLEEAIWAAKRQTPTVFYVGETRKEKEWQQLMEFAGSGHLTVTTAHAGSLVETMEQILRACNADSPVRRGMVAQRLLAVIHQKAIAPISGLLPVILPSLWWRTERGVSEMIAHGLASLIPHSSTTFTRALKQGCLGRSWFLENLLLIKPHEDVRVAVASNATTLTEAVSQQDLRGE